MKRTLWAVVAGILASVSALWGSYTWTISRDINAVGWSSNFTNFGLTRQTYGGYSGAGGPTTALYSMVYNGATTLGAANMVLRIPGPISSGNTTFSEYLGTALPNSGDGLPAYLSRGRCN